MKMKRVTLLNLVTLLVLSLAMPVAAAGHHGITLTINGVEMRANLFVEEGRIQIANQFLNRLPGVEVAEEGYTPLRKFFEEQGGEVSWEVASRTAKVNWRNTSGEWNARDLMLRSNELMMEYNTFQMTGSMVMDMTLIAGGMEMPTGPMTMTFDATMQYNPVNMYIRQVMDMQAMLMEMEGLGESDELPEGLGEMVTEMVWTEKAIYQKMPGFDQWIRMDLAGMDTMNMLTQLMQTSPHQSMELMDKFGMVYFFGDDVEIDGQEYYVLRTYVDADTYRKVFEEMMGGMNLGEMAMMDPAMAGKDVEAMQAEITAVIETMLASMTMDYYIDSYINKETLLTDRMDIDLTMSYTIDESMSPEGAVTMHMAITGSYHMHGFGEPIVMPDTSNFITMEEMLRKQLEEMEQEVEEPGDAALDPGDSDVQKEVEKGEEAARPTQLPKRG